MQNLEKEYKSYHNEPMPDLWNRIEAGLTDKDTLKVRRRNKIMRYMPMAAAVLVLVAVIPGAVSLTQNAESADSCAPDMAVPWESHNDMAIEESVTSTEESYSLVTGSTAEKDMDSMEDAETSVEFTDGIAPGANVGFADGIETGGTVVNESVADAECKLEAECDTAIGAECMEGYFTVLSIRKSDGLNIYELSDDAGNVLTVLCPEDITLKEGELYEMLLKCVAGENWDYVIEKACSR